MTTLERNTDVLLFALFLFKYVTAFYLVSVSVYPFLLYCTCILHNGSISFVMDHEVFFSTENRTYC